MSGTSLDGVDVVLADLANPDRPAVRAAASGPFPDGLRSALLALQRSGDDELHRSALAANALVDFQAALVADACAKAGVTAVDIVAIGAHGQTVRHRPELGYTIQLNAPARLAETAGIAVVADFRSRDVAAGGQGAPLVPAFHRALYRRDGVHRVVLNLGGMSNVTDLPGDPDASVRGWDCGPGNVLLDGWVARHRGALFDAGGAWAAAGTVDEPLLAALLDDPFFEQPPPKSTGRDRFDLPWLDARLAAAMAARRAEQGGIRPEDVQATLVALTAASIVRSVQRDAGVPSQVIVCGGGAYNATLLEALRRRFDAAATGVGGGRVDVVTTAAAEIGAIAPQHIEALAFAWLARCCIDAVPGNLPAVTGARGPRILGSIYAR